MREEQSRGSGDTHLSLTRFLVSRFNETSRKEIFCQHGTWMGKYERRAFENGLLHDLGLLLAYRRNVLEAWLGEQGCFTSLKEDRLNVRHI